MNILFITSNRLGDAVLSTGLLNHINRTYPQARITIVCGALPASIFEAVPGLEEIIVLKKKSGNRHWIGLWRQVVRRRWDAVIDLRDSAVSRLILADKRYIYSRHIDRTIHKVEQSAAVMGLSDVPPPRLWLSEARMKLARDLVSEGGLPVIGVGPTANWIGKTWPAERFIETLEYLTRPGGILPGSRIAVIAAPGEEEGAYKVLNNFPEEQQIDLIAKTDPGTAAAVLSLCTLYIGNDSGLMHCAAAVGTPTVGLFGPSYHDVYCPWGDHCRYVRTPETFDELADFPGYDPKTLDRTLMASLETETVVKKIEAFWSERQK